eukprot:2584104-Rhodomonas_salina.1
MLTEFLCITAVLTCLGAQRSVLHKGLMLWRSEVSSAICTHACYAMPGTDEAHVARASSASRPMMWLILPRKRRSATLPTTAPLHTYLLHPVQSPD